MIYYVPTVHLTSTSAEFSSWLSLKLSKYVFILKLLRTLYGCKSFCGSAALWERKGWEKSSSRWCKCYFKSCIYSIGSVCAALKQNIPPTAAAQLLPGSLKEKVRAKAVMHSNCFSTFLFTDSCIKTCRWECILIAVPGHWVASIRAEEETYI